MRTCLIITCGFLGDILFAGSIAERLICERQFGAVDYLVGFPQAVPLLRRNPFIRDIFMTDVGPTPTFDESMVGGMYSKIIRLGQLTHVEPPCVELQRMAGVREPSSEFTVHISPLMRNFGARAANSYVTDASRPIVAHPLPEIWTPRAFSWTRDEYDRGVDVPYLGFGGRLRDIPYILSALKAHVNLIPVGTTQSNYDSDTDGFANTAAILTACDYFIGSECGLANLAAGVGCPTILLPEFVQQLYGPKGSVRPNPLPKLGPIHYFPKEAGHQELPLFLTDDEVIDEFKMRLI